MAQRLTDKLVKDIPPPAKGNKLTFDSEVKGFAVRVTAAGARAFVLDYRIGAAQRRYTIGAFPDWGTTAARKMAAELKQRIDRGEDPMGARHEERAAPTVADLADEYLKEYAERFKRPASLKEDRDMLKIVLSRLGKLKVAALTLRDIEGLHRSMVETPVRANRVHALIRKMLSLAVKWGYRADNPAIGVERYHEEPRNRYLSADELARLSAVLINHPNRQSANAIRLLLLTGARRGEMLGATWDQFDLTAGIWTKPSAHTKQKKEHRVPLSAPAMQMLVEMQCEATTEFLFPGRDTPAAQASIKNFWASACREAGITGCRIHDLRHTYASILASAGLSLPIIGQLLGHTQATTTQRYAHLMDDPLRQATERVGAIVAAAGGNAKKSNVVTLRRTVNDE